MILTGTDTHRVKEAIHLRCPNYEEIPEAWIPNIK